MNEAVKTELERLAQANGGRLTPEAVVEAAQNPESPLHGLFEWDNAAAAGKYRIEQARELIRSVRIEITTETRELRATGYIRDPRAGEHEQGYVDILAVKRKDDKLAVLENECQMIAGCLQRAISIAQALKMQHAETHLLEAASSVEKATQ